MRQRLASRAEERGAGFERFSLALHVMRQSLSVCATVCNITNAFAERLTRSVHHCIPICTMQCTETTKTTKNTRDLLSQCVVFSILHFLLRCQNLVPTSQ